MRHAAYQDDKQGDDWDVGGGAIQTLYNNCSISLNSSSVNLPGWTPLTSRPKSLNLEGSAGGGRGRGKVSMAIVISQAVILLAGDKRTQVDKYF